MSFQLSPGVKVREIDLTTVVPAVATTEAALGGVFRWGPVEKPLLVNNEDQLVERFGKPTNLNAETFFTASSFLAYSNALYVSRAAEVSGNTFIMSASIEEGNTEISLTGVNEDLVDGDAVWGSGIQEGTYITNVTTDGTANTTTITVSHEPTTTVSDDIQIFDSSYAFNGFAYENGQPEFAKNIVKNEEDFEQKEGTFDANLEFISKYPGKIADSLRISACTTAESFSKTYDMTGNGTLNFSTGSNVAVLTLSSGDVATYSVDLNVGDKIMVDIPGVGQDYLTITNTNTLDATNLEITFEERFTFPEDAFVEKFTRLWTFWDLVDSAPGQSVFQQQKGNSAISDELHVVVIDQGGKFSGVPGTVLEVFQGVSRATDAKTLDGASNFYRTVINDRSRFVWVVNQIDGAPINDALNLQESTRESVYDVNMEGGRDSKDESNISVGALARAYDLFRSAEEFDVSLIMNGKARGGINHSTLTNYLTDNLVEARKDCVLFTTPPRDIVVNNINRIEQDVVDYRNVLRSTSYVVMDSGYKYMYDKYNDVYRWVPMNGDTAGLCARTDDERDAWWSPAGFNRGHIRNIVKLAWNPNKAQRDVLYKNGVNPIVNFPGQGIVMYGDKTLLAKPSAFDRINVRRLFIVLEKAIATASKFTLFEFNDEFTRASFVNMVTPFLRDVQGRRGIYDFHVVCDETNNTGEVIDRNEFIGDIYIKPARSINFITLNFVAVRTGVEFEEVVGQF